MKNFILIIMIFINSISAFSKSISIYDIDVSEYPLMKAKFFAFEIKDIMIKDIKAEDLEITEEGIHREISYIKCPEIQKIKDISLVSSIDVSISMENSFLYNNEPINLARITAKELNYYLTTPPSDFALQTCDSFPKILTDFTTSKSIFENLVNGINVTGGNDFKPHLLDPTAGLLNIAKRGKYSRIALLYTDAWGDLLDDAFVSRCIDTCLKYKIKFYAVLYSQPYIKPDGIIISFKRIAEATGGKVYNDILDENQAILLAMSLHEEFQGHSECEIVWQSGLGCQIGKRDVKLAFKKDNVYGTNTYITPEKTRAYIEFSNTGLFFKNCEFGVKRDTIITVKAINGNFNVTDISSSNSSINVSPKSFFLQNGNTQDLQVSFTPDANGYVSGSLTFKTDLCPAVYWVAGRVIGGTPPKTLKLTHPNGNEVFVIGSDTIITWAGIPFQSVCKLEYSSNKGKSWQLITNFARELKYKWQDIPGPASDSCLIKITQSGSDGITNIVPVIEWQKTFGKTYKSSANDIELTTDGGYIAAGYLNVNFDAQYLGNGYGNELFYIVKFNMNGEIQWQKLYGGLLRDWAVSVKQVSDGGFIIAGNTQSQNGLLKDKIAGQDFWIMKINTVGDIIWQKTYGSTGTETLTSISELDKNGYIVCGTINTNDVHFGPKGRNDFWVIKIDNSGNLLSSKIFGGSKDDYAVAVKGLKNGNFLLAGYSNSSNGDMAENKGVNDIWVFEINSYMDIVWKKNIGGLKNDYVYSIDESVNGTYIIAGSSNSKNFNMNSDNETLNCVLFNLDSKGNILWQKSFGGSLNENTGSVKCLRDGGYIVAGSTNSTDKDFEKNQGNYDVFVLRLNENGDLIWQNTYGGEGYDNANSIKETNDGGFIFAGDTDSKHGDLQSQGNNFGMWITKLTPEGSVLQIDISDTLFSVVKPELIFNDVDMKQCPKGSYKDSTIYNLILNHSLDTIRIDSIYFNGYNKLAFSHNPESLPYIIPPGKIQPFAFRFTPTTIGIHNAEIVMISKKNEIRKNITGEGISSTIGVINNIIDFNSVSIGYYKDTLFAATVKNISKLPLKIKKTYHSLPNDSDFTTLAGGGPFLLQPGETAKMNLRFKPVAIGKTIGRLIFEYDGEDSPAIVQLIGVGKIKKSEISATLDSFRELICSKTDSTVLKISNTGNEILNISNIRINGINADNFSIPVNYPVKIEPNLSKNFTVYFNPLTPGIKEAMLEIISNSESNSVLNIPLKSKFDISEIIIDREEIDFGVICPFESKILNLNIRNGGSVQTSVSINYSENISTDNSKFLLNPDEEQEIKVNFNGLAADGIFSENLIFTDSVCGTVREVFLTGKVQKPVMDISDISVTSIIGKSKEKSVTIVNNSERDFTITDISGITPPFELLENKLPFLVKAGETSEIIIKYTPQDKSEDNISVLIEAQPCSLSKKIQITGLPYSSRFVLEIPEISSNIGEEIEIPVYLNDKENLEMSGISAVNLKIQFNPSLLLPLDYTVNKSDSKTAEIFLENLNLNVAKGEPIAKFKCKTALGNSEACGLTISNVETIGGKSDIDIINGRFSLLGICYEGGPRLVNTDGETLISSVRPNPANEEAEFDIETVENGLIQIYMTNLLGEKVIVFNDSELQKGKYNFKINTQKLNSGMYFIILQTPTFTQSQRMVVNK